MKFLVLMILLAVSTSQISCKSNENKPLKKYRELKFSYQNCGPDNDPFIINSLDIKPNPIQLPGNLTISGDISFKANITAPLQLTVKLVKIIAGHKFQIPCVDNFGSCTYDDLCKMLPPTPDKCPSIFIENNLPCDCPFPMGEFTLKELTLAVSLPVSIPSGGYEITANFQNNQGHVGCVIIDMDVA